jgi:glycosyltransferase involved in cell wall biosynthesis
VHILFLSNLYPPHDLGGMELRCQETVDRLRARGHVCHVLTSRYGVNGLPAPKESTTRVLHLQADIHHYRPLDFFWRRQWQEWANRRALCGALDRFQPDVVFIWGMWNLSRQIAHWSEQWADGRVAYAIAGYWPMGPDAHEAYWQRTARRSRARVLMAPARWLALRLLAREKATHPLALEQVACVSEYVRRKLTDAGALPHGARVIYNGIDPQPFLQAAMHRQPSPHLLRLVYTGGLAAHKGVHTAIEALGVAQRQGQVDNMHLSIVGGGHPDYGAHLKRLVEELGLQNHVTFRGRVPRGEIAAVLAGHDVFLFTSVYDEPIARSVMEAMAAGLTVVGTPVGGQGEMLQDGANALVFPPDDPEGLAACILRLQHDLELRAQLAEAGRRTVVERFTLDRMVDEVEAWLEGLVS